MKNLNSYPLWTAVVTPMHADSTIDYESLEKVLRMQEKANNGIVVLGSTGEALNLSKRECKRVLEFTMKLNLKVPVMTGIGGYHLEETLEYLAYLETLPLDAYLMVTPLYAKPGDHGQTHWFKSLMDKASKPCMLYNVPGRTAVKMSFEAVKNLSHHKNFWAIKEASGSVLDFKKYVAANPLARVYSGDDGMVNDYVPFGCAGLVSVASNIWPLETHLYVKKALEKKLTAEDVALWKKASDTMFIASNPVPVKNILWATGAIKTKTMRAPLSDRDLSNNAPILEAHKNVQAWFAKNN
jgi:4-hydroxy-tetrahydrodipicolinate synthase